MGSYAFYKKEIEIKIFENSTADLTELAKIEQEGFAKVIVIKAKTQEQAIKEYAALVQDNLGPLREFAQTTVFSSVITSLLR